MPKRIVPPYDELKKMYDSGMSAREIAVALGLNKNTIASALMREGISSRTPQETVAMQRERGIEHPKTRYWLGKKQPREMVEKRASKIRGENHYLWKGGKSRREYRNKVKKDKCANCKSRLNLGIHHIDFDHYNNDPENLTVLCVSCHMSLHKKAYWDAIRAGETPKKSNAPTGWDRKGGQDGE
jgi:hypothetical protein